MATSHCQLLSQQWMTVLIKNGGGTSAIPTAQLYLLRNMIESSRTALYALILNLSIGRHVNVWNSAAAAHLKGEQSATLRHLLYGKCLTLACVPGVAPLKFPQVDRADHLS